MAGETINVVCLVARPAGRRLLQWAASQSALRIIGVLTHRLLPSTDDSQRRQRPEFAAIQELADEHHIPLHVIDYAREARAMAWLKNLGDYDLLLSLSWRFRVPADCLGRSTLADLNLHRGLLPGYEGAEPVRRMLEAGLDHATISAHIMTEQYDRGRVIYAYNHPANMQPNETPH